MLSRIRGTSGGVSEVKQPGVAKNSVIRADRRRERGEEEGEDERDGMREREGWGGGSESQASEG